jgi:dolichol-phosphate mannosyltransferase
VLLRLRPQAAHEIVQPGSLYTRFRNSKQSSMASVTSQKDLDTDTTRRTRIAVVIPCYRVRTQIGAVLGRIGPEVSHIYCIDDACPERSREIVEEFAQADSRVRLICHTENKGVGGAVLTGYRQALKDGAEIIVKVDGDGQMDPGRIHQVASPIQSGEADYVKGNRFFQLEGLRAMPWIRLVGNAGLSFLTKLSTGYWDLFDPTNGFTAIHANVAESLPLNKISNRYFFESDILFRLNTLRAVVVDVPVDTFYGDGQSSLNVMRSLFEFPVWHVRNTFKRVFYNYYLRNFSMASIHLIVGTMLLVFGTTFGVTHWVRNAQVEQITPPGTVMLAALPVFVGVQFLLNFIAFDMATIPRLPIHRRIERDINKSPMETISTDSNACPSG